MQCFLLLGDRELHHSTATSCTLLWMESLVSRSWHGVSSLDDRELEESARFLKETLRTPTRGENWCTVLKPQHKVGCAARTENKLRGKKNTAQHFQVLWNAFLLMLKEIWMKVSKLGALIGKLLQKGCTPSDKPFSANCSPDSGKVGKQKPKMVTKLKLSKRILTMWYQKP